MMMMVWVGAGKIGRGVVIGGGSDCGSDCTLSSRMECRIGILLRSAQHYRIEVHSVHFLHVHIYGEYYMYMLVVCAFVGWRCSCLSRLAIRNAKTASHVRTF